MTDRRRGPGQQDRPDGEDNPFAPPPEGQPDRPWSPRYPGSRDQGGGDGQQGPGGSQGPGGDDDQAPRWSGQWSRRQPRRQNGGFGEPPASPDDRDGNGQGPGGGPGWDPADPAQRHARYAVMSGMFGVLSGLLGSEWLGLLLGALALYWGISALRGGPRDGEGEDSSRRNRLVAQLEGRAPSGAQRPDPERPERPERPVRGRGAGAGGAARGERGERPQFAMAISGVVLASMALAIVATTYTVQLVYNDYFTCVDDALTTPSREACEDLLPSRLRPLLTEQD